MSGIKNASEIIFGAPRPSGRPPRATPPARVPAPQPDAVEQIYYARKEIKRLKQAMDEQRTILKGYEQQLLDTMVAQLEQGKTPRSHYLELCISLEKKMVRPQLKKAEQRERIKNVIDENRGNPDQATAAIIDRTFIDEEEVYRLKYH
jgi:hypothetical protein